METWLKEIAKSLVEHELVPMVPEEKRTNTKVDPNRMLRSMLSNTLNDSTKTSENLILREAV